MSTLTHIYKEGSGSISLLDSTATLHDNDNCPEHRLVREIRLHPINLVEGEDILLGGIGGGSGLFPSQSGDFEFGSGMGTWMNEILYPSENGYGPIILTCESPDCYNSTLQSLHYDNTADEPSLHNRSIDLEVC